MFVARRKIKSPSGFTLVELLVTISIFVILTGVVLFSQSKFNSTILLTNLAYDTALTVRQAQTFGINIKNFAVASGNNVTDNFKPYGVHFDLNSPKSFILFSDLNEGSDSVFNGTVLSTCDVTVGCVSRYNITRGNAILDLCYDDVCGELESVDILFKRPNPDAIITAKKKDGGSVSSLSKITIKLGIPEGENVREVVVQPNGLIYVAQ